MVIRIEDLDDDEIPKFVPRKKRKAAENGLAGVKSPLSLSVGFDPAGLTKDVREEQAPKIPAWRLAKESTTIDSEAQNTSSKSLKWFEKPRNEMLSRDWRIMRSDLEIHSTLTTNGKVTTQFAIEPLLSWDELKNPQLKKYLHAEFPKPTPVQRCAVKFVLDNLNTVIQAPTGSGKTLGFLVPIFEKRPTRALILAPTRELAVQIGEVASHIIANTRNESTNTNMAVLVGGHDVADQEQQLASNPQIIIATPGRLLDFLSTKQAHVEDCDYLVFDEADRMIDLGFEPQISEIMQHIKTGQSKRQTLMFSATWPPSVQQLSSQFLKPKFGKVCIGRPSETISQSAVLIEDAKTKFPELARILAKHRTAIIFVRTKVAAETLNQQLNDTTSVHGATNSKKKSMALHGNLSQDARTSAVDALRTGKIAYLVATDVASRGVDIPGVSLVVNYDMPNNIETYTHRIGRTGRAGERGVAVSLVTKGDSALFPDLRRALRSSGSVVPSFLE